MKPGKISENVLKRSVLKYIDYEQKEIARGAGIGNDCALFAFCHGAAVGSCSFSVDGREKIRHAIYAAANNLLAGGVWPGYLLLHLTLPERAREIRIQEMMAEAADICGKNGWKIVGGHTEVSVNVTDIVVTVTALSAEPGEDVKKDADVSNIQPKQRTCDMTGYDVVATGYIGMEAAGLIVSKKEQELLSRFPKWLLQECERYKDHLSVADTVKIAKEYGAVLMHDIGEGGIFASLWEMAQRAGTGLTIDIKKIPMKQSVVEICNHYDLNPYEILSQGCLLIAVKDGEEMTSALNEADIPAAVIGKMTDSNDRIIENGEEIRYLDLPKPDQIRKIL
ncbi:MAG: hydrogenase maturation factor [Lachnospiraceae bacterium]|nr:hydrogenase maturation factor [Lachnospiraceae bacterium]